MHADRDTLREEMRADRAVILGEIKTLREEMHADRDTLREEMRADRDTLREEMHADRAAILGEIKTLREEDAAADRASPFWER